MAIPETTAPVSSTLPAVDEKEFTELYVVDTKLTYLPSGRTQATARLRPYDHDEEELYPESALDVSLNIYDLWTEADRVPLLATELEDFMECLGLLYIEAYWVAEIARLEAIPEDTTDAEAALAAVQTSLGIT